MITLLVMIHIITSHQGYLQNKNLLDKQIHVETNMRRNMLILIQTMFMVKEKGEELIHQRSMDLCVHVVTEKTSCDVIV